MKIFQKVRVKRNRTISIPIGTVGRVARYEPNRSQAGYDTLVIWYRKLSGKRMKTWAPKANLEVI